VEQLEKELGRDLSSECGARFSSGWRATFLDRHADEIKKGHAHFLSRSRAELRREDVEKYFAMQGELRQAFSISPDLDFEFDETMVLAQARRGSKYVIIPKTSKFGVALEGSKSRHVTLGVCVRADGLTLEPLVILPIENLPGGVAARHYDVDFAGGASGWINGDILLDWVRKVLVPHVAATRKGRSKDAYPAMLRMDGHASRDNLQLWDLLAQHNIITHIYPSNATQVLSALDVHLFGPFKQVLLSHTGAWRMQGQDSDQWNRLLTAVMHAYGQTFGSSHVREAFAAVGLRPFDPQVVLRSSLLAVRPPPQRRVPKRVPRVPMSNVVVTREDVRNHKRAVLEEDARKREEARKNKKKSGKQTSHHRRSHHHHHHSKPHKK
jgi:hypothetical protein